LRAQNLTEKFLLKQDLMGFEERSDETPPDGGAIPCLPAGRLLRAPK
jgi:hypothetical protein